MMDLQEAVVILESSLNIDCSYPAAIKEIDARMMVAEVAKAELEREKGCDDCDPDCTTCGSDKRTLDCRPNARHPLDCPLYRPRYNYCPNCGRKLV